MGSLSRGQWLSVALKLGNTQTANDNDLSDLSIFLHSARNEVQKTDISSFCVEAVHPATECTFTYQITDPNTFNYYLVLNAPVEWQPGVIPAPRIQTYNILIKTYNSADDLNADSSPITTLQNTDALRKDIVKFLIFDQAISFMIQVEGATSSTQVYFYSSFHGVNANIDEYISRQAGNLATPTGTTGLYSGIVA